jgi:hypothetical protein
MPFEGNGLELLNLIKQIKTCLLELTTYDEWKSDKKCD